jgi:hypothetical protein
VWYLEGGPYASDHEIFRPGMMHDNRRSALLRLQQESGSQTHPDILFRLKQSKQLGLVLQARMLVPIAPA